MYKKLGNERSSRGAIEEMVAWSKAMEVKATPTIFINGNQLPDAYSIEDLQYFLLE